MYTLVNKEDYCRISSTRRPASGVVFSVHPHTPRLGGKMGVHPGAAQGEEGAAATPSCQLGAAVRVVSSRSRSGSHGGQPRPGHLRP